jgi:hypothetical protein
VFAVVGAPAELGMRTDMRLSEGYSVIAIPLFEDWENVEPSHVDCSSSGEVRW